MRRPAHRDFHIAQGEEKQPITGWSAFEGDYVPHVTDEELAAATFLIDRGFRVEEPGCPLCYYGWLQVRRNGMWTIDRDSRCPNGCWTPDHSMACHAAKYGR